MPRPLLILFIFALSLAACGGGSSASKPTPSVTIRPTVISIRPALTATEQDPRSATIQQATIDGSGVRVYAKGLRNPYDLTLDDRGRFWATDNGSDTPCATIDELDLITDGGDYGWPYSSKGCDPYNDGTPPIGDLGLHTAATGITFYNASQFPAQYRDSLFITLWGGTIQPVTKPALVWAAIEEPATGGKPTVSVHTFATGFDSPIDVVADSDGSLLVLDHGTGKLYRILYTGTKGTPP